MYRCLNCMKEYGEAYEICPHCGFVKGTPPKEIYHLAPGTMLSGRYVVGTVVGVGGFGVVYRAWDENLEKMVALKEYYPATLVSRVPGTKEVYIYAKKREDEYRIGLDRFLEEARNMARFSTHPNIVNVYNFFEENNTAYCVMEFMDGISYKTYIKEHGGIIEEDVAIKVTTAVLDALTDIHKAGIIHRDIAPDNVMILTNGVIKLMDFGAARFSRGDEEKNLTIILKPGFAPPEQYKSRSKQGAFTDLYAVGAMLYRAVTGIMPEESTNRLAEECLAIPKELNPDISDNLNNVILRAMAVQPELRFQNTQEFKEALSAKKKVLDAEQELKRRRKLRKRGVFAAALFLLIGVGIGGLLYDVKKAETVLKPADLIMWVSAESGEEQAVEAVYDAVVSGFLETYPQISVDVVAIPKEEYITRLQSVQGTDKMPDVYESTSIDVSELADATGLDRVFKLLTLNEYYGLGEYQSDSEKLLKLPVSFNRPIVYVNSILVENAEEDITADILTEEYAFSTENLEAFKNGELEYLVADTAYYFEINATMAGRYKIKPLPAGKEEISEYALYFSVSDSASRIEENAAYQFMRYLLSDSAQYQICVTQYSNVTTTYGLPLNKVEYAVFKELNFDFANLSEDALRFE